MTRVISAQAVSVDAYITGRKPRPGRGLGEGSALFDWYTDDDGRRRMRRLGAVVPGRNTYGDSGQFGGGGPHTARVFVPSHRPVEGLCEEQSLVTTGIEDVVEAARKAADGKDVALMGGGALTSALAARLVEEMILHEPPIQLSSGRPFFQELSGHVRLSLVDVVRAPGVTHLHHEVVR